MTDNLTITIVHNVQVTSYTTCYVVGCHNKHLTQDKVMISLKIEDFSNSLQKE